MIIICQRCGKKIDKLECFSGQLCLSCYEKEYEKMTEEEKKPDFTKTLDLIANMKGKLRKCKKCGGKKTGSNIWYCEKCVKDLKIKSK